ncbi:MULTISPECIES: zonular occludens toxin domain-containing protein [Dehalobacter]|uniref:zonular occludens toxin domain-containing protein n=1 Tax=Dehalobacter TaxID=56112 RepID=UPI00037C81E1|nr:zonular occludens toxin domain-containing protein [Dehalobacter sp.]MDJ0304558.1 hypothetical protein [Dehalobacter sp.]
MITSILFSGQLGSGKSVSAVSCAVSASELCTRSTGYKVPIFSNITLKHPNFIPLENEDSWRQIVPYRDQGGSIVLLDETQSLLDSRLSGSKSNIRLTQFFSYLRKLKSVLILTTPAYNMVDVRVRLMLTYHIYVHRQNKRVAWDIFHAVDDSFVKSRLIPASYTEFFKYYDTNELVIPVSVPENLQSFMEGVI